MNRLLLITAAVAALAVIIPPARAQSENDGDERITFAGENWAAGTYESASGSSCLLLARDQSSTELVFLAHRDGVGFLITDPSWSMPGGTSGAVTIAIGAFRKTWPLFLITSDSLATKPFDDDDGRAVLSAIDTGAVMKVTVGKMKYIVPLGDDSRRASNVFHSCAGLPGGAAIPGASPFSQGVTRP